MPAQSVKERVDALASGPDTEQLYALLSSLVDGIQALATKLDNDAGVTDTNYAAVFATFVRD